MALDPKKTALIVIDVQNDYFDGKWPIPDGNAALDNVEAAIEASQQTGAKVIYVQHEVLDPERGIFIRGTNGFELHPRLHPRPEDHRIVKHYPGSFSKTDLEENPAKRRYRDLDHLGLYDAYVLRYNRARGVSARFSRLISERCNCDARRCAPYAGQDSA